LTDSANLVRKHAMPRAPSLALVTAIAVVGLSIPGHGRALVTVRISTGPPTVSFRPLAEAMVRAYGRVAPDLHFVLIDTPGSVRNIQNLQQGTSDIGFALADVAYMGYNGRLADSTLPLHDIRGIAVLHSSTVHLLAGPHSGIRSIGDLKGRRIGMGPTGSGAAVTSEVLLRAFHVLPNQVEERPLPFAEATDQLIAGALDAAFVVSADPTPEVKRATEAGARLLEIRGPTIESLRANYPFLRSGFIPADMYTGHPNPIHTLSLDVLLLGRAGLDEGLVHRLTLTLFQVLPQLGAELRFLRNMDPSRAAATPIPLHPGAALFYREQELAR